MRGTDCTPGQLEHASKFINDRGWPYDAPKAVQNRDELVRLVAWYGALRFTAARDGVGGTLEVPGEMVVKP